MPVHRVGKGDPVLFEEAIRLLERKNETIVQIVDNAGIWQIVTTGKPATKAKAVRADETR